MSGFGLYGFFSGRFFLVVIVLLFVFRFLLGFFGLRNLLERVLRCVRRGGRDFLGGRFLEISRMFGCRGF